MGTVHWASLIFYGTLTVDSVSKVHLIHTRVRSSSEDGKGIHTGNSIARAGRRDKNCIGWTKSDYQGSRRMPSLMS